MSQLDDVAYGLVIFKAYGLRDMGADHDVIYCYGPFDRAITDNDLETLDSLGWRFDQRADAWARRV
jgi:hypothetical protein